MTSSCLQGLPFHTPVYNTYIACRWLCDPIAESGAVGGGASKASPPACKLLQIWLIIVCTSTLVTATIVRQPNVVLTTSPIPSQPTVIETS